MMDKINSFLGNTRTPRTDNRLFKQMKNGSAPGINGITIEFIKMFWSRIVISYFESAF